MKKKKSGARALARLTAGSKSKRKTAKKTKPKTAKKSTAARARAKSPAKSKSRRAGQVAKMAPRLAFAAPAVAAKQAAVEPECMDMGDAIRCVRKCLAEIAGSGAGHVDMGESISNVLPDSIEVRRYFDLIRRRTGFDLDPVEMGGGTFQDIADVLACA